MISLREIFVILCGCLNLLYGYDFELPKEVKPKEYKLFIYPNLTEGTYSGQVTITVNVTKNTDSITLHSKNLTITRAKINTKTADISFNAPYDFLILKLSKPILKGSQVIGISFEGDMKNKPYGFFRGYEEVDDQKIYFGASFLEPINARGAFPCFDEPTFKARFSIQLLKPSGYVALSNMNQINETLSSDNHTIVTFATTPPMSPYLVSLFVGNYSYVEDLYVKQNGEVAPTRMYSPSSKIRYAQFGAHQIPKQIKWFANYTGFDFMLPKLDYITINSKFHMPGGMEDWGAISTNELFVLYDDSSSKLAMRKVFHMGHEFAHIWFGDLVTTSSWGEFWLNEGFARFMDRKVSQCYSELEGVNPTYAASLHNALWRDDDLTARPLSWKVKEAIEAYEVLSTIAYDKGSSVLRMVEDLIGEDLMQSVLRAYLKQYQYQNVVSENFIEVLQNFVSFNASDFLVDFIKKPGYPLITVNNPENKTQLVLTRERFLRMGQEDNQATWTVPIKYITNLNNDSKLVWFKKSEKQLVLEFPEEIEWVKLNPGQSGYYRVNYLEKIWSQLIETMKNFTIENRINLIDDSMALVRSGHVNCSLTFRVMNYLYDEPMVEAWETAANNFEVIRLGLLQHNLTISHLKTYIRKLIDKQYRDNKWSVDEDESIRTKATRNTIFNLACYYGHEGCRKKVEELWEKNETLPIDIKYIVLSNNPGEKIDYNSSNRFDLAELSGWFGADLSVLPKEPVFRWPKHVIQGCNNWLQEYLGY